MAVLAAAALVPAYAIAVVASGGWDDGCPSPRQVTDALAVRVPAVVLPPGQAPTPGAFRLAVTSSTGAVRLQLIDAAGEPALVRTLPPGVRGRTADCPALAESVALIVDRYLHDIGYEAPPLPPPAPPPAVIRAAPPSSPTPAARTVWQLGAAAEARLGDAGSVDGVGVLSLSVDGPMGRRRAGARLAVGMGTRSSSNLSTTSASLRRMPLRAGAYLAVPAGPGRIEPGLDGGVDVLLVSGARAAGSQLAPFGDVTLGYLLPFLRHIYVRAMARGGVAVPYTFQDTPTASHTVWSTPRTYLEFSVESGVSFP